MWHLYLIYLILQVCVCLLVNTEGHTIHLLYLVPIWQPYPLALCPLAAIISLLLLLVCAYIIQVRFFTSILWFLVVSSLVLLRLSWCIITVLGYMFYFPTCVIHWTWLLVNTLYIFDIPSQQRFLGGVESLLHSRTVLGILLKL